ncbi:MAG: hypothetical protein U0L49_01255, partial [Eubacterium sp.]|nr:hypothetical protein [Eubacterium sp.]
RLLFGLSQFRFIGKFLRHASSKAVANQGKRQRVQILTNVPINKSIMKGLEEIINFERESETEKES